MAPCETGETKNMIASHALHSEDFSYCNFESTVTLTATSLFLHLIIKIISNAVFSDKFQTSTFKAANTCFESRKPPRAIWIPPIMLLPTVMYSQQASRTTPEKIDVIFGTSYCSRKAPN